MTTTAYTNNLTSSEIHHHAVHDRAWTIEGDANGTLTITSPHGRIATEQAPVIEIEPARKAAHEQARTGRHITEKTISTATNEPCDLHWVVGAICDNVCIHRQRGPAEPLQECN